MASTPATFLFSAVTGYFVQDDIDTDWTNATTTLPGLGLIDREYETDQDFDPQREKTQWQRFTHFIDHLNKRDAGKAMYKLIYATRHGQGYHNAKETEVGTAAWEAHWAPLDGDGVTSWFDSLLTPTGQGQARDLNTFWRNSSSELKLPLPQSHYASPLTRCMETQQLSFKDLTLPSGDPAPSNPVIKELLRELMGIHSCDRRRTRSYIQEKFSDAVIEEGFTEEDELWKPDVRETRPEHAVRVSKVLGQLFQHDPATVVAWTAHCGTIIALYMAIGHKVVCVLPGSVVPVLVKAEII
ncbi:histidine phosphatase superfamily [Cladorrhinum samala]|uniref:Histidine phosphatase superfamily n=1 Tax=Cladorrhinum samala TaxID=585594 RepID=A0AAV9HSZ8_9PEZI|nr:histidine phosphatase superfamily [Cladorrhinum samala]